MAKIKKPLSPALEKNKWKKGQSGNPLGGKLRDEFTSAMKKLTLESYREIISGVVAGNTQKLEAIAKNPNSSILEIGIINSIFKAAKNGDYETIEKIVSRVVGKIPDEVKITADNTNTNLNAALSKDVIKDIVKELKEDV